MKLRLMICAMAASTALFATDPTTSSVVYGVMGVSDTASSNTVVGVPWGNADAEAITLSNLVSTATLATGDIVYLYESGTWKGYTLLASKVWDPMTTINGNEVVSPGSADAKTLSRGTGLIIQRASNTDPIYLCGRHQDIVGLNTSVGAGATVAVSDHWLKGGKGAIELAEAVIAACERPNEFAYLCDLEEPLKDRIEKQVKEVYGGDGVDFEPLALEKLAAFQSNPETARLPICIAKTQYSLSHDPKLLGRPKGWRMPVKDILIYSGAGLIVPVAGEIKLMPGTSASPAYRRIDVDVETGKVKGLF